VLRGSCLKDDERQIVYQIPYATSAFRCNLMAQFPSLNSFDPDCIRAIERGLKRCRWQLPGGPNLRGHAVSAVVQPKCDSRPEARTVTRQSDGRLLNNPAHCGNLLTLPTCSNHSARPMFCANRMSVSFPKKETDASSTAAAYVDRGFGPQSLVTIGMTNAEFNRNTRCR
jgi:hypothetical protein